MPGAEAVVGAEMDAEEALADGKEAVDDGADGKVGAQVFLREGVLRLAQFFGGIGNVPRGEVGKRKFTGGVVAQRRHFRFACCFAFIDEVVEEAEDGLRLFRHFVGDG